MAFHTTEHRNVAEVHRMLEGLVRLVAELAFVIREASQVNRMLKGTGLHILFWRAGRVVDHCMADVAIIPDYFAGIAHMLAIMTAKTARGIKMSDVVGMRLPIGLPFGKEVGLKNALNLFGDGLD